MKKKFFFLVRRSLFAGGLIFVFAISFLRMENAEAQNYYINVPESEVIATGSFTIHASSCYSGEVYFMNLYQLNNFPTGTHLYLKLTSSNLPMNSLYCNSTLINVGDSILVTTWYNDFGSYTNNGNITFDIIREGTPTSPGQNFYCANQINSYYPFIIDGCGASYFYVTGTAQDSLCHVDYPIAMPIANFVVQDSVICAGLCVQFTNLSTNYPVNYHWDFGNGDTAAIQNPTACYDSSGIYTVSLIVSNAYGEDTFIHSNYITVNQSPVADFSFIQNGIDTILFSNQSIGASSLLWEFGDGDTSTQNNPTHIYTSSATFHVTLTVSNGICPDTAVHFAVVNFCNNGTVSISANTQNICAGGSATLTAIAAATNPVSYQWNLNGNSISGATQTIYHATQSGSYSCSITDSCSNVITSNVIYINVYPALFANIILTNDSACAGSCVSASFASNAQMPISCMWSMFPCVNSSSASVNICCSQTGNNTLYLTVFSGGTGCSVSTSTSLTILPFYDFTWTHLGYTYSFTTTAPGTFGWHWSFGDGDTSNLQNPVHNFLAGGNYSVTLTLNNSLCGVVTHAVNVNTCGNPAVSITSNSTILCGGNSDSLFSSVSANLPVLYQWKWNNYNIPGATSSFYVTSNPGNYKCVITDSCGQTATSNAITLAIFSPTIPSLSSNSPTCEGLNIQLNASTVVGATYHWSGPNSFSSSLQNPTITNSVVANSGYYNCYVTVNGCNSIAATTQVVVNPVPSAPVITLNEDTVCACHCAIATATSSCGAGASYNWNIGGFGGTANVCSNSSGTISVTVYQSCNGCVSPVSSPIYVTFLPSTSAEFSYAHNGLTYSFTDLSTGAIGWHWNFGDGDTSNLQNPIHTYFAEGNFIVTLISTNGNCDCSVTHSVFVNGCHTPFSNLITAANSSICASMNGDTITNLSDGTHPLTYQWYKNGIAITNATDSFYVATTAGSYKVKVIDSCGEISLSNIISLSIVSNPVVNISPSANQTICPSDSVTLTASGATNYLWSNGATTPIISVDTAGSFYVVGSSGTCNDTSAVVNVSMNSCTVPAGLSVSGITSNSALAHWSSSVCAIGYQIYFRRSQYTNWQYANIGAGANSFTLTNLQNNYNVQWKIRTKCSNNTYTAWSAVQTFLTLPRVEGGNSSMENALEVSAFPNPTSGEINLQLNNYSDEVSVLVQDISGKILQQTDFNVGNTSGEIQLSLANFAQGIYLITVIDGENKKTVKVVRE